MPWSMHTDAPSFPCLNSVKLSYFPLKSTGQMVFTSWREVGSRAWIWHLEMPLTLQTSEESSAKSLMIDHTIRYTLSVLHRTPETHLTDLSLTCSLTCPAGAERTHCGVETTGHPAPLATRCNPGFCCSRQSGWSRPEESGVGWSGIGRSSRISNSTML